VRLRSVRWRTDDTFATPGAGFAVPNRAVELLAPYRQPSIA
jgi:hypothetical protein